MEKYMEPYGAVCMAYVKAESKNHLLLRKLGRLEESKEDAGLANLQVPIVAAVNWRSGGAESMEMIYRKPFQQIWPEVDMSVMDEHDAHFAAKAGATWKESAVRKWLFANAYPTINVRVRGRKEDVFPEARYASPKANSGAAALAFINMTGENEVYMQFRVARALREQAERLKGKVRFSLVERSKETRELRQILGVGLDLSLDAELILLDRPGFFPEGQHELNHYHGDSQKYRLQNLTVEAVDSFFTDWERGFLPTHWATKETWVHGHTKPPQQELAVRLTGESFESLVLDGEPKQARLVAFFNDDPTHNCMRCEEGRAVWESVARAVKMSGALARQVLVAAIDQSLNEHPETLVPAKVAQPMIVWYPAGSRKQRLRKRRLLSGASATLTKDNVMEELEDILLDEKENGEL